MSELPEGWTETSFMDVFDIQGGTQPPKSVFKYEPIEGYVRLLQIRDFGDKPLPTYVPDKASLKRCIEDDVLIGRYGASVGRICTGMNGAYNVALAKVIVPKVVDKRFAFYFLKSELFQRPILDIERSAQDGFNKEDLSEISLLLVPLNEQRRIVAKLEKILRHVDAAQARLATIPRILKRFRQSVLAAACAGRLTADWRALDFTLPPESFNKDIEDSSGSCWSNVPSTWNVCSLKQVVTVTSGYAFPSASFVKEGVPAIKISNIQYGEFIEKNQEYLPEDFLKNYVPFAVYPDDLLMALTRPITNNTLKVCLYPQTANVGLLNQRVCKFTPLQHIEHKYLYFFMQSESFKAQVTQNLSETLQPNLSPKILDKFQVCLPPYAEQQEIVRRVEALFKTADALEARYRTAKEHVDKLAQSILARAFRGELVTTEAELARREGRDYEPASVLLERIRQARARQPTSAPKRKPSAKARPDKQSRTAKLF
jgi:type I restriction enzyme S subunit